MTTGEVTRCRPTLSGKALPMVRTLTVASILALLCCSTGCTSVNDWVQNGFKVGPNYGKPPAPVAPEWIDANSPRINPTKPSPRDWWTVLKDPVLNQLVETAYRQNLNVRVAGTRILQARAERNIAAGNLLPQLQQAFADYKRIGISGNSANIAAGVPGFTRYFDNWSAGLNLSWELDFWGRFRRAVEAADANFDASIENYDDVLVLLIGDVAGTYVQIRTFQERIKYAEDNIAIQDDLTKKAKIRLDAGGASKLDLVQMKSNLASTQALKEQLEQGLRLANNNLCVLLGIPPRDLVKEMGAAPIPTAPEELFVGVPADLLTRRPDVRQAERQAAAQSARIGVAVSDLYPHLSIVGSIGYQAENLSSLFTAQSLTGNIGPSLRWDILNYGRLLNNIRLQDARFQQAVLTYQQTVLNAGREVEDGMTTFLKAQLRALFLTDGSKNAKEAVDIVLDQIKDVKFDVNRAFVTSNFLVQQQDQMAVAKGDVILGLIQVYRSLGGGWEIRLKDLDANGPCLPPSSLPPGPGVVLPPANMVEPLPAPEPVPTNTKTFRHTLPPVADTDGKTGPALQPPMATLGVPQPFPAPLDAAPKQK